ncbi:PLD nuclease N-terminal domain-containing protein [Arthrobacter sp. 35W]|uniref:PLD nuclease N-terminal domain-containing protein n=1 Tax=Arthrobacter sp. 35W TaxID=1132441 RepID=UPI0003FDD632|nr:PLD nuclease N-terminal domain-containing protein [Arthrobacter sp. 35W]
MKRKMQWKDLSPRKQRMVAVAGVVELVALAVSMVDLVRRPATEVNGNKGLWGAVLFINPIGPICYWLFGRRRPGGAQHG